MLESAGGRSMPPQEQKLEAIGTIIAEDGLTVLSLTTVDPKAKILSRLRTGTASVQVNYRSTPLNAGWFGSARQDIVKR